MHSNPIRPSALTSLTLASIYILSPYVSICSLASCFIYYTHIDIASIPVLTLSNKRITLLNTLSIRRNNNLLKKRDNYNRLRSY